MPVKKNGETRHKILDELLQKSARYNYSMKELNALCNEQITEMGYEEVDERTTLNDIKFMRNTYLAPIVNYRVADHNPKTGKLYSKLCYKYEDKDYSIFHEYLSKEEKRMLNEALTMFSQFSGLPNESAMNLLRAGMRLQAKDAVVGFSKSPMGDSSIFSDLFKGITNRLVINLHYHTFQNKDEKHTVVFHPYYLREYNRRWYIFGAADDTGKLLLFGLDRIDKIEELPNNIYKRCKYDIEKMLSKVVGVSMYDGAKAMEIIFWVSDVSKEYVLTKKIHETQYLICGEKENLLRQEYPQLEDGAFFNIECPENYELIRELCSYGPELIVVNQPDLQKKIIARQEEILERYYSIRK